MATIGDVAREAGVSRSTVSSVLTGRKFVTPETRARIETAIAKLEYSVNTGARALATSKTMTFGVVVRFHEAEFSPALATYLVALSDAAREPSSPTRRPSPKPRSHCRASASRSRAAPCSDSSSPRISSRSRA